MNCNLESPYAFLASSSEDRALVLRLLWEGATDTKSLRLASGLSLSVTLNSLRRLIQKGIVTRRLKSDTKKGINSPYEFSLCLRPSDMPDINSFLGLYNPPLTGIDLRGQKYMLIHRECKESLSKVFDWEHQARGKFTWSSLINVADFVGLPIKTCCQFLEYIGKLPDYTWDRAEVRHGITSKILREKAAIQEPSFVVDTQN